MSDKQILNEIDSKKSSEENVFERQETSYVGIYLGGKIDHRKDDENSKYGRISLYFNGVRKDNGEPWYSVQDQFMGTEEYVELIKGLNFGDKVRAYFMCGNTPGGKQRLSRLEKI